MRGGRLPSELGEEAAFVAHDPASWLESGRAASSQTPGSLQHDRPSPRSPGCPPLLRALEGRSRRQRPAGRGQGRAHSGACALSTGQRLYAHPLLLSETPLLPPPGAGERTRPPHTRWPRTRRPHTRWPRTPSAPGSGRRSRRPVLDGACASAEPPRAPVTSSSSAVTRPAPESRLPWGGGPPASDKTAM